MELKTLYINGSLRDSTSEEFFTTYNPATGEAICQVSQASQQDVDEAISNAKQGFKIWSAMSAIERSRILLKAVALLR